MLAYRLYRGSGGKSSPVIYVVDSYEHPFALERATQGLCSNVVGVPIRDWSNLLTPWPAACLYKGEPDFEGQAETTLAELCDSTIPSIERNEGLVPASRAICGYSLGGLFSMYAIVRSDAFDACACLSGSVWYEGWVEYLQSLNKDLRGRFAFLSLGTKERRAARPILKTVQDRMDACALILQQRGCSVHYQMGPGNHLYQIPERLTAGLAELDQALGELAADE